MQLITDSFVFMESVGSHCWDNGSEAPQDMQSNLLCGAEIAQD